MRNVLIFAIGLAGGCLGTGPETPPPPGQDQADDGSPRLSCPEGTEQQSGTSDNGGEEYWCARAGVMHGPFKSFHPNGIRAASGTWVDNQRSGQWTWWYADEQTRMKGKYDRGKQIGSWQWWHPNGNRKMEGDFLLGRKQGQWTTFYESGNRESQGMYHNDQQNEIWSFYADDDTDTVIKTERFENGKMVEEKTKPR